MMNLKKIVISTIIFLTFFIGNSYTEEVKKLEIKGNERISVETIMIFGDVTLGKNYQKSDINLLIKKLYETNFFSNISVALIDNKLSITVEENPIINSIVFNGEKAKKFKERIREITLLTENGSFIENNIKNDVNQIKSFYRNLFVWLWFYC